MIRWSTRTARIVALGAVLLGTVGGSLAPDDVSTAAPAAALDPATLTQAPESADSSPTTNPPAPTTPEEPSTTAAPSTTVALPSTTTATVPETTEAGTVPSTTEAPTASTDVPITTDVPVTSAETVPPSTDVVPSTEVPPTTGEVLAPGPDAGAVTATLLAAAPDTYGPGSLDDADAREADTTFAAGRSFQCGDVVVYFDVLDVSAAAAAGSSTVTLVTDFDTSFSGGGTGFTDVAATLAIDDSTYAADGNESLATDVVTDNATGALELTATVGGVDAGEHIVVEYRATLGCDPADAPAGALAVTPDSLSVTDALGATTTGAPGEPVVLDASRIKSATPDEECPAPDDSTGDASAPVSTDAPDDATLTSIPDDPSAPADCEPYIVGEDGPLVLPEGCEQVSAQRAVSPGQVQNPTLPKQCGTAVTVVIDESGSINTAGATGTVRSALTALVNGLNNTGSTMAFVEFSSCAAVTVTRRAVTTATRSAFDSAITAYNPTGTTNWTDALSLANAQGGALTLVITDGNPNVNGTKPANAIEPSNSTLRPLYYAAANADTIKSGGSHMFVIGVGDVTPANLQVISGDIAYSSALGIGQSDYIATSFANLEQAIRDLVFDLCSSSLTITKTIGGVAQSGWTFTTTITPAGSYTWDAPAGTTGTTASVTTGTGGTAQFQWSVNNPGATVNLTINEASKAGNEFSTAVCTVSRPGQSDTTVTVTTLPITINSVPGDAIVKCDAKNVQQTTPATPTVTAGSCVNGAVTNHTITVPANTTGIVYTWPGQPTTSFAGTSALSVVVTATAQNGYILFNVPAGWTANAARTSATFTLTAPAASCRTVNPGTPTATAASCAAGVVTNHVITVPANTADITYTWTPQGTGGTATTYTGTAALDVTVTATLVGAGTGWPTTLPTGWTRTGNTTATFRMQAAAASCTPVQPGTPTAQAASCVSGAVTNHVITVPTNTASITYTWAPLGTGSPAVNYPGTAALNVTVTATLAATGVAWGTLPQGWTRAGNTTATFLLTASPGSCTTITPAAPSVTPAQCVGGTTTTTPHHITPATTTGVTYTLSPAGSPAGTYPASPGQNVTVTATLTGTGVAWPASLPTGWTRVNDTTATFTVTLASITCVPVQPVAPTVTQASCANGVVTTPTVVLATTPTGVSYSASPAGPYSGTAPTTVTVTATLAGGFAWGQLPAGWVPGVNPLVTALFTVNLVGTSCTQVSPVTPTVALAQCVAGAVTTHQVTPATTTNITYTLSPPGTPAGTYPASPSQNVTVTATLAASGVAWPATLPSGWSKVNATTATFTVALPATVCTPVQPVAPAVTQATCRSGVVTAPTVVAATTPTGVSYVVSPPGPYVGTVTTPVTVTATLADGFAWGQLPAGWLPGVNPLVTARFPVTLVGVTCDEVTPVAPTVIPAQCVAGATTPHIVTTPTTTGVTYTLNPPGTPAGSFPASPALTVTVTATLAEAGVGWAASLPDGWTLVDATTATFTVSLPSVTCTPVQPVSPTVTQATCRNGAVTQPTVVLATTPPGVSYVRTPAGPYSGTVDTTVTVRATLADGFAWGQLPDGWVPGVDLVTALFTVDLVGTTCAQATPVAPTVRPAVCVGGAETAHTITPAITDRITYTLSPAGTSPGQYPASPGQSVTVTARLAATGVAWPDPLPDGWTLVNATTATFTVDLPTVTCTPTQPVAPTVTQATCAEGVVTQPTIVLATTPPGVSYVAAPQGPYSGTVNTPVTVTATLSDGLAWGQMPNGWTNVDPVTAALTVDLVGATCAEVTPAAPSVVPAVCTGGSTTTHSITPALTDGITYSLDPSGGIYSPAAPLAVTVTATLANAGVGWPAVLPDGWTETSDTTATFTVNLPMVACIPVQPVAPAVTQATCSGGLVTAPTVVLAGTPAGISYSLDRPGPYGGTLDTTVTVTATLGDGFAWGQMPDGWIQLDLATATFTVRLLHTTCDEVTPVAPSVTPAVCAGGTETTHRITTIDTDGIIYTLSPPGSPGLPAGAYLASPAQTVTVAASLSPAGVGWPAVLPEGWTRTSASTATFTIVLPSITCTPTQPVAPAVTQATCTGGVVTAPTVVLPAAPAAVTYSADPQGAYDGTVDTPVTVTATLADGFAWGQMPDGWARLDPVTATFVVNLVGTTCADVTPVAPSVTPAVCTGGSTTMHSITPIATDGITYTLSPPGAAGLYPASPAQPVTVTATLTDTGVAWPASLPDGWTRTSPTTATFTVELPNVTCVPTQPVGPFVTQATCSGGVVTAPTIDLATTSPGISYVVNPPGPYDGTKTYTDIVVTATLAPGFEWGQMPPGWVQVDDGTATFNVTLVGTSCAVATPVAPTVTLAQCVGGAVTDHTVAVATTDFVTYTLDPPGSPGLPAGTYVASPGQDVTVTATLAPEGVGWPDPLPDGWTETSDTTATFTVSLPSVACVPVQPVAPTVVQASCVGGVVTVPTVVLATTPQGVSYVADPQPPYVGTVDTPVTITATLANGFEWGQMPDGWTSPDPATAVFVVDLQGTTCAEATPVAPTVTLAQCVGGAVTDHTVAVATTDFVTYTLDPPGSPGLPAGTYVASPGQDVTVTATLAPEGVGWPDPLPDGWTETSDTTATFTVSLPSVACVPVQPVAPTVVQASCVGGVVTVPTVVLATTPQGVSYVADPQPPYVGTVDTPVTITATLAAGFEWGQMPDGWTSPDPATAVFVVDLQGTTCAEATPVLPTVVPAVCVDGAVTSHTITLPTTDNITYSLDPAGDPAGEYPGTDAETVTVTATLAPAGVGWPDPLPDGWTPTSTTTATHTVALPAVACTPLTPVAPDVTQASCTAGVVTAPEVLLATSPAGITYVAAPQPPYDGAVDTPVTVTATLSDGFEWGTLPNGWDEVDLVTRTYSVTLTGTSCAEVTPVLPTVTQAVCLSGALEDPTLELATTDGITYAADPAPPYAPGETVTVTATLDDQGVGWPAALADGWERTSDTEASTTLTFDDVSCTPVSPVAPIVVATTCVAGDLTPPTVTLAVTPGISYVADPPGPYDPTVESNIVVTATLADGYAWDTGPSTLRRAGVRAAALPQQAIPAGWTIVDPTTATFAISLPPFPPCPTMTPVAPSVTDPQCVDGTLVDPSITLATTEGVSYVAAPAGPYVPGDSVTVTATITDPEAGWVDPLPDGWTHVDQATATFAVTFADDGCTSPTTIVPPPTTTVPPVTTVPPTLPPTR